MTVLPTIPRPSTHAGAMSEHSSGEVPARAKHRTFTGAYKLKVLAEYEAAAPGKREAVLRREGLYSSVLVEWRRARDAGALARLAVTRGRPPADPVERENMRLRERNAALEADLDTAHQTRQGRRASGSTQSRTKDGRKFFRRRASREPFCYDLASPLSPLRALIRGRFVNRRQAQLERLRSSDMSALTINDDLAKAPLCVADHGYAGRHVVEKLVGAHTLVEDGHRRHGMNADIAGAQKPRQIPLGHRLAEVDVRQVLAADPCPGLFLHGTGADQNEVDLRQRGGGVEDELQTIFGPMRSGKHCCESGDPVCQTELIPSLGHDEVAWFSPVRDHGESRRGSAQLGEMLFPPRGHHHDPVCAGYWSRLGGTGCWCLTRTRQHWRMPSRACNVIRVYETGLGLLRVCGSETTSPRRWQRYD